MSSYVVKEIRTQSIPRRYDAEPSHSRNPTTKVISSAQWRTNGEDRVRSIQDDSEYVTGKKKDTYILPDLATEDQRSLSNALKARRSRDHNKACMESALECNTNSLLLIRRSKKKLAAIADQEPMLALCTLPKRLQMTDPDSLSETSDSSKTTRSFASEINDVAKKVRAEVEAYTAFVEELFSAKLSALEMSLSNPGHVRKKSESSDSGIKDKYKIDNLEASPIKTFAPHAAPSTSANLISVSKILQKSVEQTVEDSRKKIEKVMESNFNRLSEQYGDLISQISTLTKSRSSPVADIISDSDDIESDPEEDPFFKWEPRTKLIQPITKNCNRGERMSSPKPSFANKPQQTAAVKSEPRDLHSQAKRRKVIVLEDDQDGRQAGSKSTALPLTHFLSSQTSIDSDSESDWCRL